MIQIHKGQPKTQVTNLLVRLILLGCIVLSYGDFAAAQFEMPANSSTPERSELAGYDYQSRGRAVDLESNRRFQSPPRDQFSESEPIQFQLSSRQYQSLKFFVTGGCVALIVVLLGSMLRLSASDDTSQAPHRDSLGSYPMSSHHWGPFGGNVPLEKNVSHASGEVNTGAQGHFERQGRGPEPDFQRQQPVQFVQPAAYWPVTYIPAMPISPASIAHPQQGATQWSVMQQSEMQTPQHQSPQPMTEESCQVDETNHEVVATNSVEQEADVFSVEEMVMRHIQKGAWSDEDSNVNEQGSATLNSSQVSISTNPDEIPEGNAKPIDPLQPTGQLTDDHIVDPIAEDLANLPVETYGEEVGETDAGLHLASTDCSTKSQLDQEHNAEIQGSDATDVGSDLESVELQSELALDDAHKKISDVGLFDAIVASTVQIKSLAS